MGVKKKNVTGIFVLFGTSFSLLFLSLWFCITKQTVLSYLAIYFQFGYFLFNFATKIFPWQFEFVTTFLVTFENGQKYV